MIVKTKYDSNFVESVRTIIGEGNIVLVECGSGRVDVYRKLFPYNIGASVVADPMYKNTYYISSMPVTRPRKVRKAKK